MTTTAATEFVLLALAGLAAVGNSRRPGLRSSFMRGLSAGLGLACFIVFVVGVVMAL